MRNFASCSLVLGLILVPRLGAAHRAGATIAGNSGLTAGMNCTNCHASSAAKPALVASAQPV